MGEGGAFLCSGMMYLVCAGGGGAGGVCRCVFGQFGPPYFDTGVPSLLHARATVRKGGGRRKNMCSQV